MNVAIIAAAGRGSRFGGDRAKQFVELCGIPVIVHTLRRFESCPDIKQVIGVFPPGEAAGAIELAARYGLRKLVKVVPGGETRLDSVRRGFAAIRETTAEIVAVHDGARPLVTPDEIGRTIRAAAEFGAAILTAPVTDTIKMVSDGAISRTLDRTTLRRALTPQSFRYDVLRRGLAAAESHDREITDERLRRGLAAAESHDREITDESMLIEALGEPVHAVEGSPMNIKITHPDDIAWGEHLLRQMQLND